MEWLNHSELEINEFGDRLEVIVRTQTGMFEWIAFVSVSVFSVFLFAKTFPIIGLVVAAIAVFSFFNAIRASNENRLTVRSNGFIVEGGAANPLSVSLDEIHGIGYSRGDGEGDPSGFYAFKPLSRVCLVPRLDESECQRIKSSIETKYPDMQFGKKPITSLFGDGPEIITLGLHKPAAPDSKPPIS